MEYQEIEAKIDSFHNDQKKAWELIQYYIKKAKEEKNNEALVYAYRYASNFSKYPENINNANLALNVAKSSQDQRLLANAYLNRGTVFFQEGYYQKSLDDVLVANINANNIADEYITYKSIYLIAQNKIYLGLHEDAAKELQVCINFFKKRSTDSKFGQDYQTYYIYSLLSYIDNNTRMGKMNENKTLISESIDYLTDNNLQQFIPYFISSQGTDAFYQKDYQTSIKKLTQALEMYNDKYPHITEIYYLGLNNWKIGKRTIAVKFMEVIDNQYNKSNRLDPQFRSAYEILIKYNDSIKNRDKQLEYIDKLMILDKSYEKNFKYLYPKINKEYDTKKLISEKNKVEKLLILRSNIFLLILIISLGIILFFSIRYYRIKKLYKQRFENIIINSEVEHKKHHVTKEAQENTEPETVKTVFISDKDVKELNLESPENLDEYYSKIPGLNPLVIKSIMNQLDTFEYEERYLDSQLTQKSLVEELGTNSTYLSKIINTYKGSNFNIYINNLRLNYIIDLLRTDANYLQYDVKELANICGFSNAESFSDNFYRKFEIKPSYFVKMMKEKSRSSSQSHNPTSD
ncbi:MULTISPECIES: helix-turn-helix domain-containing protein [unclassified Chryseobacterium]|uniref:helix-turn-helix domain-containing protein n=1 Tax=unclassified Chryseobacterium TaxID=2593645 RepID=UPI001040582E|nr:MULTISPECIES: AraC family transcriptional regulator [unclassified Chryseobacterium]